ncbi:MAG: ABC transporter permease [Caldilineae bacterium]|nr:MAG: ABC transporter permease [Caldilineae bacterium]
MTRYIAARLVLAIPTFLAVLTLVFFVVRVIPGDPAVAALGDYASKEAVEALRERMGLNDPLYVQYFRFLADLARGDLGTSMITGKEISELVRQVLPYTLQLTVSAIIVGSLLGVPIGIYTARNANTGIDYVGRILSLSGLSVPAFYLGILIMLLFAVKLELFPAVGGGDIHDLGDNLRHLFLPALTLGLIMTASVTRLTRSAMLNVLQEDFVRTARAKGLKERVVVMRHALRAALVPIVSIIGIWAANLIADSVLTETVFARPGLGKMLVGAIMQRDYTALQSVMVIYTMFVVGVNLITDIVYSFVDPRITH